jgi:PhnB protein
MKLDPYLSMAGRAEEALDFYQKALGAKLQAKMRLSEMPAGDGPGCAAMPPGWQDKILHSALEVGGNTLMLTDGMGPDAGGFKGVSLSLAADDAAHAERLFNALGDGGQVQMPLAPTFFSPLFGVVADRFGVSWMIGFFPDAPPTGPTGAA